MDIRKRKDDHITICLERDVQAARNHWDDVMLVHEAVPSRDLEDIELGTELLGRKLSAPLIIAAMTGGSRRSMSYNKLLARAAEEHGIGLGVGSQRAGLEEGRLLRSYTVVKEFEVPLLLGNLGAPQASSGQRTDQKGGVPFDVALFERARDMIGAHAICLHLNYLQEVVQPEGETKAYGLIENIRTISGKVKLVAKETGGGISRGCALSLKKAGVSAIDVGGLSGTSFSAVESFRYDPTGRASRFGTTFREWGLPTPVSVIVANVGLPLIATGGLRTGLDIARSLSLGASSGGMAWTLLKAASKGYEHLSNEIRTVLDELRAAVFLSGVPSVREMGQRPPVLTGVTREIVEQLAPGRSMKFP
ncbi:MAG: type 2 isopentenyl-diphosphate Delta-isomerase [Candidatus Thermoplasmatota archaeon]|jgi:isopentenyl-diphosphate delta-isomerase|nr:type 2 isopentenyl-diphosphate Delta-isomerase [Candidatus Thermoplasmatota archaeon]